MIKRIFYSLLAITIILTLLTFSSLEKVANWVFDIKTTEDSYASWEKTVAFRRTWGLVNLAMLITLTIYAWIIFNLKLGINRILLAVIGIVGILLFATIAFFAVMYSNRII